MWLEKYWTPSSNLLGILYRRDVFRLYCIEDIEKVPSMQNEESESILATLVAAEKYFRQQQVVHGNIIYSSPVHEYPSVVQYAVPVDDHIHLPHAVHEPSVKTPKIRTTIDVPVCADARPRTVTPADTHGTPVAYAMDKMWANATTLNALNAAICTCSKCPLGSTRTKFVFGTGRPDAGVMVIGEAPGAEEDEQGEPFVGKAGQLLMKILDAVNFAREDVFIANILKCRPPDNRRPSPAEVAACEPFLWKQIELLQPKIILCLGLTAAHTILGSTASLGVLRDAVQSYRGIPLIVTYHPAALLRNPNWKKPTWEDVKKFRKMYDDIISAG